MKIKNIVYILSCLAFCSIIGAAIFEHLAVWPNAYAAPPKSLSMFQGEYGIDPANFWRRVHPVTLLLFIATTILFWKSQRRKHVLVTFGGYLALMIFTGTYFVPELIDIISTPFSQEVSNDLVARGKRWEVLSIIRLLVLIALAVYYMLGLTKEFDRGEN